MYSDIRSSQFIVELSAAENVEMEVMYGLASIGATVGNNAVAVTDSCAGGDQRNIFEDISDLRTGFLGDILDGIHVHFRNNENVNGGLRIQILESEDLVIFVNFGRRDETCGNFTKNTIFHNENPFLTYDYFGWITAQICAVIFIGN